MPRAKRNPHRDLADARISDLIPISATAEQVLEDQHRLLEAYRRGQEAGGGQVGQRTVSDTGTSPWTPEGPQKGAPQGVEVQQRRVDDWMNEVLLPKAQALAPGADIERLQRLILADKTLKKWLRDRAQGKDSPGDAGVEGALVQMLKRGSIATSQSEDDDGE